MITEKDVFAALRALSESEKESENVKKKLVDRVCETWSAYDELRSSERSVAAALQALSEIESSAQGASEVDERRLGDAERILADRLRSIWKTYGEFRSSERSALMTLFEFLRFESENENEKAKLLESVLPRKK